MAASIRAWARGSAPADRRPLAPVIFERRPRGAVRRFSHPRASVVTASHRDFFAISAERRAAIQRIAREFVPGRTVALSTHINADGDGCGSEAGLARLLMQRGLEVRIVNPTPWPALFDFLLGDDVDDRTARGAKGLDGIDLLVVL